MSRKAQLDKQIAKLAYERNALDKRERQKRLRSKVGRYFKYRNSYSCPEKPSDSWWLYSAVFKSGDDVLAFEFQVDKDGKTTFEVRQPWQHFESPGWTEISAKEYETHFDLALTCLRSLGVNCGIGKLL